LLAAEATVKWPFDQFRRTVVKPATGRVEKEARRQVLMASLNGIRRTLMTNQFSSLRPLATEAIAQSIIAETIFYGRRQTRLIEGPKANFDARLTERRDKSIALKTKAETRSDRFDLKSNQCTAHHRTMSVEILQQPYELLASGKVMAK
jgi:hypothetical protein